MSLSPPPPAIPPLPEPNQNPIVQAPVGQVPVGQVPVARRRGASWTALIIVIAAAVGLGFGIYMLLAQIDVLSFSRTNTALAWGWLILFGFLGGIVGFVVALVAGFRSQFCWVAVVAIIGALVLPPLAGTVGAKLGTDSFRTSLVESLDGGKGAATRSFEDWTADHKVDLGPLTSWFLSTF